MMKVLAIIFFFNFIGRILASARFKQVLFCSLCLVNTLVFISSAYSQEVSRKYYSLEMVIDRAHEHSLSAQIAKHNFRSSYWDYRSYRAQYMPSLNLNGSLGKFNRSIEALQSAETGQYHYINNNSLDNSLTLSIDQNIGFTGGRLSLYTHLDRLDEFSPNNRTSYFSEPVSITYLQPIGGFNNLKWDKKIKPQEYELAKRTFLENMENVTLTAVEYFFALAIEQLKHTTAVNDYENSQRMLEIAKQRFAIGAITKDELLQIEVNVLTKSLDINDSNYQLQIKTFVLKSFLGMSPEDEIYLVLPEIKEDLVLKFDEVLKYSYEYSPFQLEQDISVLNAERAIAQAKGERGFKADLAVRFGLSQSGDNISSAYRNPADQEVTGLTLAIPIFDAGLGKGRVRMAQSQKEVVDYNVMQNYISHEQEVYINVLQFNNQVNQCRISQRVKDISAERYDLTMRRFLNSNISVTEMNIAQSEQENAAIRYLNDVANYWKYYYTVRKLSMYDFISNTNISAEFDRIIKNK